MKNLGLPAITLLLAATSMSAQAVTIADTYIGADDHRDVVGTVNHYQVNFMDVEINGTILTVSINTTFAGKGDNGLSRGSTIAGTGIGYGDLFLNNVWTPFGTSPYKDDDASNGTVWSHGFSLDDRFMSENLASTGVLYSLNAGDNDTDIMLSDDFIRSTSSYRSGQEVAVDRSSTTVTALMNASGWSITADTVDFQIDLAGTGLLDGNELALRWQMSCANDVIEGAVDLSAVPVPAAVWLFGSGLIGLVAVSRRKNS